MESPAVDGGAFPQLTNKAHHQPEISHREEGCGRLFIEYGLPAIIPRSGGSPEGVGVGRERRIGAAATALFRYPP